MIKECTWESMSLSNVLLLFPEYYIDGQPIFTTSLDSIMTEEVHTPGASCLFNLSCTLLS
jgi:hypothetical protein